MLWGVVGVVVCGRVWMWGEMSCLHFHLMVCLPCSLESHEAHRLTELARDLCIVLRAAFSISEHDTSRAMVEPPPVRICMPDALICA